MKVHQQVKIMNLQLYKVIKVQQLVPDESSGLTEDTHGGS